MNNRLSTIFRKISYKSIAILFILSSFYSFAQKQFSVKIKVPEGMNKDSIAFYYDDGRTRYKEIKATFSGNETILSEKYYARYATIFVEYTHNGNIDGNDFWVDDKGSTITFLPPNDSITHSLRNFQLKNAYPLTTMGAEKLEQFYSKENKDFVDFVVANNNHMTDSLVKIAFEKGIIMNKKITEFVRANGDLYYAFWIFRHKVVQNMDENADSLIHIYTTVFADSLKNSDEGHEIMKFLNGRKLNTSSDSIDFTVKDIKGKDVTLSKQKSQYVLLAFWASWCGPCVKEVVHVKELRKKYSTAQLEIISVTWDKEFDALTKAVKKLKMNWTHIFDSEALSQFYGVVGIPDILLIDVTNQKIVCRETDINLANVKKILAERLE